MVDLEQTVDLERRPLPLAFRKGTSLSQSSTTLSNAAAVWPQTKSNSSSPCRAPMMSRQFRSPCLVLNLKLSLNTALGCGACMEHSAAEPGRGWARSWPGTCWEDADADLAGQQGRFGAALQSAPRCFGVPAQLFAPALSQGKLLKVIICVLIFGMSFATQGTLDSPQHGVGEWAHTWRGFLFWEAKKRRKVTNPYC